MSWHTVVVDLFHRESNTYLLVGVTFPQSLFVRELTSLSSSSLICNVKCIFEEHIIPETVISDNCPQFASQEFKGFPSIYGFEDITNGFIEKLVGTVKGIFTKCRKTNQDPHFELKPFRETQLSNKLNLPAELLSGRKFKIILISRPPTGDKIHKRGIDNLCI